MRLRFPALNQ
ncbi:hypothetical protein LIT27_15355 [Cytobacillus oceanisediminis]|nr:hypothetical protein [Virgibacillus massiliensis]USK47123.1 hypothetical protein LIT27_15355 [Cytobacillus oceanisediminis]